ncbi:MAG: DUF2079 domain-containing protein [Oscillospiraceae bacterium]|nr:DUF2079 domain-containing protein [Oscillospiraceae bacterium]
MVLLNRIRARRGTDWVRLLATGWLFAVLLEYLLLPGEARGLAGLAALAEMSLVRVLVVMMLACFGLALLPESTVKYQRWAPAALFAALVGVSLPSSFAKGYLLMSVAITAVLAVYALWGWDSAPEPQLRPAAARRGWGWAVGAMAVAFGLFVSLWTVGRVAVYSASTYDFGIFAQMFHNMAETGLPMTTLERDGLLSHFHVHVSPIYYLLLPFYMIVPRPHTLQVLQAAVLASAVIPLWLLCKNRGFSGLKRTLACGLLLLLPVTAGGASYDIHENCFLLPLILWLFYGIERKNIPMMAIAGLLTLMVKEDAAVYVAVVALWLLVKSLLRNPKEQRWELIAGASLLAMAVIWFLLVTRYLATVGDGVMTNRYQNFMFDGNDSLLAVIRAAVVDPLKVVYECADPEKWRFIIRTMLPLLGLPLLTRRFERYILLIPYILINLMSDYPYQHDVMFQYNFGSTACLMYLLVANLAELKWDRLRTGALVAAMLMAGLCFYRVIWPSGALYIRLMSQNTATHQLMAETLERVPADAVVTACGGFTPHLAQRAELYDVRYASREHILKSEYVVLQVGLDLDYRRFATAEQPDGFTSLLEGLERNGFRLYDELEGEILIYKNTEISKN